MYYSTSRLGPARRSRSPSASPVDAWEPASPPVLAPPHPPELGPDQGERSPTETVPYKCQTALKWQEGLMGDKRVVLAVALPLGPSSHSPYSTIAAEGRDLATPENCVSQAGGVSNIAQSFWLIGKKIIPRQSKQFRRSDWLRHAGS
ncbi:hypothetical protein M405DRAFT_826675 [Rhizopogon salebrosus TDB-379]|nr:hypothetical protein M405DRAFT_826675 [Rhizopogon salebrosus TDB-379]